MRDGWLVECRRFMWCKMIIGGRMIFFFNDTATTEIYTLSLHDALPILVVELGAPIDTFPYVIEGEVEAVHPATGERYGGARSEEHTSELQSHSDLVCRLLLEKKKKRHTRKFHLHIFNLLH